MPSPLPFTTNQRAARDTLNVESKCRQAALKMSPYQESFVENLWPLNYYHINFTPTWSETEIDMIAKPHCQRYTTDKSRRKRKLMSDVCFTLREQAVVALPCLLSKTEGMITQISGDARWGFFWSSSRRGACYLKKREGIKEKYPP